jgi:integrase
MSWTLQKQQRAKGLYCQVVWKAGSYRRPVTLGYLGEDEARAAIERLRLRFPPENDIQIWEVDRLTEIEIRHYATAPLDEQEDVKAAQLRRTRLENEALRPDMTLRQFHSVWEPVRSRGWSAPGHKRQRSAETAARTWERDRSLWAVILVSLGSVRLNQLTNDRWARFLASGTWARRTKVLFQNAYRVGLMYAASRGAISALHAFDPIIGDERSKRRGTALLAGEVAKLIENAPARGRARNQALWALGFGTGARPCEARSARWEEIQLDRAAWHVAGEKTDGADRVVPLLPETVKVLTDYWHARGKPASGWMFPNPKGDGPVKSSRTALGTAAKRAGITERIHPNMMRHSFASMAAHANVPMSVTREVLGHTSRSAMLEEYYLHAREEVQREALTKMPSMVAPRAVD